MGGFLRSRPGVVLVNDAAAPARFPADTGPAEFAAPVGGRVRVMTAVSFAIVAALVVINAGLHAWMSLPARAFWPMLLAPLAGALVVAPIYFHQRILGYRVADGALVVRRHGRLNRFPLADLAEVTVNPQAMRWSLKLLGNDGLGAITGWFRNETLGRYQALVTDRSRAVVLRWPGHCLVVSPDRPAEFSIAIRAHSGLKT